MIIQKIKHNRKTVAFIGQRADGQIYFAFGTPSQHGGYIAFDAKDVNTAQQKISEYLHPEQKMRPYEPFKGTEIGKSLPILNF